MSFKASTFYDNTLIKSQLVHVDNALNILIDSIMSAISLQIVITFQNTMFSLARIFVILLRTCVS